MKISSLIQLKFLTSAPREKKAPPHIQQVEVEGCWLKNVFEGARVRYDLLGFGPILGSDDKDR